MTAVVNNSDQERLSSIMESNSIVEKELKDSLLILVKSNELRPPPDIFGGFIQDLEWIYWANTPLVSGEK